jgi:hypothetical protein
VNEKPVFFACVLVIDVVVPEMERTTVTGFIVLATGTFVSACWIRSGSRLCDITL